MTRTVDATLKTEILKSQLRPIFFIDLDFSGGAVRAWSGYGDFSWDSKTWLGVGDLWSISPIEETEDLIANGLNVSLTIKSSQISLAFNEHYQGRSAKLWMGAVNQSNHTIIGTPLLIYSGLMDVMSITDDGEQGRIDLTIESRLSIGNRAKASRYTDREQQRLYPGDTGLRFVAGLQEKKIVWGS